MASVLAHTCQTNRFFNTCADAQGKNTLVALPPAHTHQRHCWIIFICVGVQFGIFEGYQSNSASTPFTVVDVDWRCRRPLLSGGSWYIKLIASILWYYRGVWSDTSPYFGYFQWKLSPKRVKNTRSSMIFTCIVLNAAIYLFPPPEVVIFGWNLTCLLLKMGAHPLMGTVLTGKANIRDTHIRV